MAPRKLWRVAKNSICNHPGCRVITTGSYCPQHDVPREASPRTERDKFLDTAAWRRLSAWKLGNTPWCERCMGQGRTRPAEDVHHVLPRRSHPHLALEPTNLQSLCKRCHRASENMDVDANIDLGPTAHD